MSFYHFVRGLARVAIRLLFSIRCEGLENVPEDGTKGYILCSNHIHALDPVVIGVRVKPRVYFMAKEELFHPGLQGKFLRALGAFPVSREKGDVSAMNYAVQLVKEGHVLGIFPEGTRSKTGKMGRFKSGAIFVAAQTGGDLLPCVIKEGKKGLWRRKLTVRYGKMIPNQELGLESGDRAGLRTATQLLSNVMSGMLEEIHE